MILLHGNVLRIEEKGLLLLGESGVGKSAVTLALLERAQQQGKSAALVADDYVHIMQDQGSLWAFAPKALQGHIEIWGAGIYTYPFENKISLTHAITLGNKTERYPQEALFSCLGQTLPMLSLLCVQKAQVTLLCHAIEAFLFRKKSRLEEKMAVLSSCQKAGGQT